MPHESHHLAEIAGNDDFFFESLSLSLFNPPPPPPAHLFHLKSSKYLLPARELLGEFCGLGGANWDGDACFKRIRRRPSMNDSSAVEANELLKRKVKLLSMLEEVDKRYRRYREQMKALVSAFEDTAGEGAARTYSMLASKAMSRHFRCLRDGIDGQMRATRRALGECFADDDVAAPGLTRGETPRLRLLASQCKRQSKAFLHVGMSIVAPEIGRSSHPWRPQRGLPERSVSILRAWLFENFLHPYPSDIDKHILAGQTRLSKSQVSNWFINARVRLWKPMIEEMYLEELKEEDKRIQYSTLHGALNTSNAYSNPNPNLNPSSFSIEKPRFCAREPIGDEVQFSIFEGETPAILAKTSEHSMCA